MSDARPNILWICTDQQRYDTLHALGNSCIRTPNLDALIGEGVAFTRAYCQSPICTPSRSSFLTGLYPSMIHVNRNGNAFFPPGVPLITRTLADAGFDCGLSGKLHLSACHGRVEQRPDDGYRVFQWSHHPKPEPFWPTRQHHYQQWLADKGVDWDSAYGGVAPEGSATQETYRAGIAARYHQTTWCAEVAVDFIRQAHQDPWLMSVNPFDPHPPFDPPPEYLERMDVAAMPLPLFDADDLESHENFTGVAHQTLDPVAPEGYDARRMVAAYYAQIELLDDQVGRMLAALDETGQRDDTIVIFTSDHGEMLGDHGLLLKGCRFYEGAVHVPLIVSWPGHFQGGLLSSALVELVDLAPTILEATGLPLPERMHGRSLLQLLQGKAAPNLHRSFVRCEYHDALKHPLDSHANMIYDGHFKLCLYHGQPKGELYDLDTDPHEFRNLWDNCEFYPVRWRLTKELFDGLMLSTDEGQPRVGNY